MPLMIVILMFMARSLGGFACKVKFSAEIGKFFSQ